jgi:hypothetical protein
LYKKKDKEENKEEAKWTYKTDTNFYFTLNV